MPADVLSGGSTPKAAFTSAGELTEMRPGVYVVGDAQQLELCTCSAADVALTAAPVNLVDDLVVTSGGSVVDRWRVAARGANT